MIKPVVRSVVRSVVKPVVRVSGGPFSWSAYWRGRGAFWSDGTIVDGKLNNTLGDQDITPSLVESNCLQMAVDDTIDFDDLSGWSIVSGGGTAEISIVGNSVKCTSEGTLYNLILSDGSDNHTYPLAEGGCTIAYDTFVTPVNGTINCVDLIWTTQDEYHKNVEGNTYTDEALRFLDDDLTDAGDGLPEGYSDTYSNVIATIGGVTKVTVPVGGHSAYHKHQITKLNSIESGKDYYVSIRVRQNVNRNFAIRLGSSGTQKVIAATTEWQTLNFGPTTSDNTYISIIGASTTGGDWFEFSIVKVVEDLGEYLRIPKRDGINVNAEGGELDVIGNGYFIDCETKLKFPDITYYQTVDDHLEYFYDKNGTQQSLSYSELYENVYRFERVFCSKSDNRLIRMIVVNPLLTTREKFKAFLDYIDVNSYIYRKITKGAFVFYNLGFVYEDETRGFKDIINNKGASVIGWGGGEAWVEEGNYFYSKLHTNQGMLSFEFLDGEEMAFADEIASGDLLAFDAPDGERGGGAKVDWPDFTTVGVLQSSTKQNGTVILDGLFGSLGRMIWIPSGESGVPVELEEVPLYINDAFANKLYYGMWPADDFFGVTFTNTDEISFYEIEKSDYDTLISLTGLTCVFKHHRSSFELSEYTSRLHGFIETTLGEMCHYSLSSQACWDAGMIFGSNSGTLLNFKDTVFANQDTPRKWCASFGHHGIGNGTTFNEALTAIENGASENKLIDSEFESGVGEWNMDDDKLNILLNKCDEVGMLFLSPFDLIKNFQWNDYNEEDFFTGG